MEAQEKSQIKQELKIKEKINLEIRDLLAIERTKFANERTFLAYIRTAMGLVLAGFSLTQFFESDIYKLAGLLFIPLGVLAGFYGLRRFLKKKKQIEENKQAYTPTSGAHAAVAKAKTRKKL